jgi:predicted RNA binding protein with dsRBD fold (UPF0201 family)
MTGQKNGLWSTIATMSMSILVGVGVAVWLTPHSPLPDTPAQVDSQHAQRLVKLEQAVTALTQVLHGSQTKNARSETTRVAGQANDETSRQALAQLIRDEIRRALADASPAAQRAREEALANAEVLNSPENRVAYQNASDVVHAAVATKRWTEEDKETFRDAFIRLTNDQRAELMDILAPAINRGEITVEVNGPLF